MAYGVDMWRNVSLTTAELLVADNNEQPVGYEAQLEAQPV